MDIVTLLIVGLVAGLLASFVIGGVYGIVGDIVVGVAGSFIGGYVFQRAGWHAPWPGLPGTIFVAFIGAALLLVVIHILHGASRRRQ